MRAFPLVHILIPNWNGCAHLESCLPSLVKTRFREHRIVVLDNGSTDGSCEWVRRSFPRVQLIDLGRNLGFAQANNVGIRAAVAAGAKYVVLLNNDTRVDANWLDALVEVAERNVDVAICSSVHRGWEGEHEIRFRYIPEWAEVASDEVPLSSLKVTENTPVASGCGMLVRCSALVDIGLFDDRYFAYVEDVDLCLRAWIMGYRVVQVSQAILYHKGSMSSSSHERMFWGYRNQLTTLLKLYQLTTLRGFGRSIAARWLWTRNRIALRGALGSLVMLPGTIARRAQVQKRRVEDDAVFLDLCYK